MFESTLERSVAHLRKVLEELFWVTNLKMTHFIGLSYGYIYYCNRISQ